MMSRNRFAAFGPAIAGVRAGEVQKADPGGERGAGAQLGLLSVEPVVQIRLAHCGEHAQIGGAHAGRDGLVGAGPLPHRPLQRPVPGATRDDIISDRRSRGGSRQLAEIAPIVAAQLAPGLHERGAIGRDVGEVPVEAALGHCQSTAQPIDLERLDAFLGQNREAGLDPVVDRQSGVRRGPRPPHERQPTAPRRPKTDVDVTSISSQENDSQRQSGCPRVLVTCFTAVRHN